MNIVICHERFIFRFGADRVLILLAKGLRELGHEVTLLANRYDAELLTPLVSRIIDCPVEHDFERANDSTRDWLEANWNSLFNAGSKPDIIFVGGWPFISALSFFRQVCSNVVFIDFGVVPNQGYSEQMIQTLEKLRALRRQHLPNASLITPISQFIADSQSRPETQGSVRVRPILLGADHLTALRWQPAQFKQQSPNLSALTSVRSLKQQGRKVVLALGRWEAGCYKNSQAALEVLETLRTSHPTAVMAVLEHASNIQIPDTLRDAVLPLGFPDDQELSEIMKEVDLAVSVSQWEGFNLPLAEMQWLGRPALALDAGAHPEVAAHPWYLCRDTTEMAAKAATLFQEKGLESSIRDNALEKFRSHFRWDRFLSEYVEILAGIETMSKPATMFHPSSAPVNTTLSDAWKRALYPDCICTNWQMNDSERMALTGLLARHQPRCSIEVGTFCGGSLSLISQYSKIVFSIDIDESISSRFNFPNVNFLTGYSHAILPHLFNELDKAELGVDFILIDGDHSALGVKKDIACLLAYVPKRPLFVALHDSFNPECRRGMRESGWGESPYCHWVDLDFVPGKIAGNQMWGGLALAHFLPIPRSGELVVNGSAEEMFQTIVTLEAERTAQ